MNPEFNDLINSLQIKYLLIVENDFTVLDIDDAEKVLSLFSILPEFEKKYLIDEIDKIDNSFSNLISSCNEDFKKLTLTENDIETFLKLGEIIEYLKTLPDSDEIIKLTKTVIDEIKANIKKHPEIKDVFLKFGIAIIPDEFKFYIYNIRKNNELRIRVLNNTDTKPITVILTDIEKVLSDTGTDTFMTIVDKIIGDNNNAGVDFINKDLIEFNKKNDYKLLSVILTSKQIDKKIENLDDYLTFEVSKQSSDPINDVFNCLLLCSYIYLFNFLKVTYIKGVENTFDISKKNPKNIIHILKNANIEGISSYEAITDWFNLVLEYQTNEEIKKNYNRYFGFSKYFNSDFPLDEESESDIGKELKEINSYEIFDYGINEKYLPIACGDIFKKENKYFLLLGQSCDISLRETNIRKSNIAELIEIEIIKDLSKVKEKYKLEIKENDKVVYLKNFKMENDEISAIKIKVDKFTLCDFRILDICMFSNKGESIIDLNLDISDEIKRLLPDKKDEYFIELKKIAKELKEKKYNLDETVINLIKPVDFNLINFVSEDISNLIDWNFKRLCRIKEPFLSAIYDNYIFHKGRIGLNMIDNAPEIVMKINLQYSFFEEENKKKIEINLWEKDGKKYIKKNELMNEIETEYKLLLNKINTEEMYIEEDKKAYKLEINNSTIVLLFAFYIERNNDYHKKSKINYQKLFKIKDIPTNKNITFLDNNENRLIDNNEFSIINDLSRKIKFAENNKTVSYENGIIKIEE